MPINYLKKVWPTLATALFALACKMQGISTRERNSRLSTVFQVPAIIVSNLADRRAANTRITLVWGGEGPCSTALSSAHLKACATDCTAACLIVDLSAWKLTVGVGVCAVSHLSHLHIYLPDFLSFITIKNQIVFFGLLGFYISCPPRIYLHVSESAAPYYLS